MADRVERYEITIPALTQPSALLTSPMKFHDGTVLQINIKVPPGPAGNVGFYIAAGGSQWLPRTVGSFIIPDDDDLTYPISNAINSGDFALVGYNTDVNNHLIQVEFQINELPVASFTTASAPVSL